MSEHQLKLSDGGLVTAPMHQYQTNQQTYEYITDRLDRCRRAFMDADPETQTELVRETAEYAIISVQTNVRFHEPAFLESRDVTDQDELAQLLVDHKVTYHNNKARFLVENRENAPYDEIAQALAAGRQSDAHATLTDEVLGVRAAKAAFSLAMLGFTGLICVDSNTAATCGLDASVGGDLAVDEYGELVDEVYNTFPELAERTSPFVYQWILFDSNRDGVELHDPYYERIEELVDREII